MFRRRGRAQLPETNLVRIGTIDCPSGQLVLIDGGYMNMWSGEGSPAEFDYDIDDPVLAASFAAAVDFEVVGPDAVEAARTFNRQSGTTLYDIPEHGIERTRHDFDAVCAEHGLKASLQPLERVPHRERVRRAAPSGGGGGFLVNGVWVVAAAVETGELPIEGIRVDFGGRVGEQWAVIVIGARSADVASTREIDIVGVDHARVLIADADALSRWQHELPMDGQADLAYWGAGAQAVRDEFGGEPLPDQPDVLGWANLDAGSAFTKAQQLEVWQEANPDRKFAFDFRPHSHHWVALRAARTAEHEIGVFEFEGVRACLAITGWGDGLFPVLADFDGDGKLVRVRLVLGDRERADRMEQLYDRWAEG
jgi:hypothetical protein